MRFVKKLFEQYKNKTNADRRQLLKFLLLPTTSIFSCSYSNLVSANEVMAVRVWPSQDYTRITIETSELLQASHILLQEPYRLVIDVPDLKLSPQLKELLTKVLPDNPHIAQVRVGQFTEDSVRIVFDLKQAIKPQVFSLSPISNYKYRLVFDLHSKDDEDDLISQILKPKMAENVPPLSTRNNANLRENDPLKEWLNGSKPSNRPAYNTDNETPYTNLRNRKLTLVIDPGHGGEDPGAIGANGLREKDVVLSIAKILANIASRYVRVVLTRDADFFVPLNTRVLKARAFKADVFVSIHADAFTNTSARGSSVFALSEKGASSSLARMLATMENNADIVGGVSYSHSKDTQRLLLGLSQDAQIRDSLRLGSIILNNISEINPLHKNKVEQAGFAVLKAPDIPSILVETAFISNFEEEQKLSSTYFKEKMAQAIWDGIRKFLRV
jgi:N-acetylmuramoyl-L-alanine amidase